MTVKLDPAGRWHVSLLVNADIAPLEPVDRVIGLDAGISALVTTSDGQKVTNPRHFNQHYRRLRRAHKALARKQKASRNRERTRRVVARVSAKIADCRKDFLHKLTTKLVRENQTVVVEDLAVKNMVKNHKLARAISDAGWGEMVRQLTYKCQWYGRTLVQIDRWFPSTKRCGTCGHILSKLPLSIREWTCPECGCVHDRDVNAARNILAAGLAESRNACGADVRPERDGS